MRKTAAILALAAICVLSYAGTYDPSTYVASGGGGGLTPRVTAELSAEGDSIVVRARANMGIPIALAMSAYLDADTDSAWAVVAAGDDTSATFASGTQRLAFTDWDGATDDVLVTQLRVHTAEGLAYSQLDTFTLYFADEIAPVLSDFLVFGADSSGVGGTVTVDLMAESTELVNWETRFAKTYLGVLSASWASIGSLDASLDEALGTGYAPYTGYLYVQVRGTDPSGNVSTELSGSTAVVRATDDSLDPLTIVSFALGESDSSDAQVATDVYIEASAAPYMWELDWKKNHDGTWSDWPTGASSLNTEVYYSLVTDMLIEDISDPFVAGDSLWVRLRARHPGDETYTDIERVGVPFVRATPADETAPTLTPADSTYTESLELAAVNVTSDEAWYPSYRTRVNAGAWSSYTTADTTTTDAWFYYDTTSLTDGDVVRFGIGGTDAALNAATEVYRDVTVSRAGGSELVPATAFLLYNGSVGSTRDFTVSIYDGDRELVASSETISGVGTTGATIELDFTAAPALSAGTYYLALTTDGTLNWYVYTTTDTWQVSSSADVTAPDPLPSGSTQNYGHIGLWVENSSGTMILGHSDTSGDYSSSATFPTDRTYWVTAGYTVE